MIIQINSDNNLILHDEYRNKLNDLFSYEMSRFNQFITRLEVHLSDENGAKSSVHDKRCMLEVRQEGKQPIAVTEIAETYDSAIAGAIEKLKTSLDTIQGKLLTKRYRISNELLL